MMILTMSEVQVTLDGDADVVVRRDFSHPPARVWRALTEPALIQQWLGEMKRCEVDLRPGGGFHYEWDDFYFWGQFLDVDAPYRMTHVENFSGDASYNVEIKTDLVAHGSGTRMAMVMRYPNPEARASAIASGFTDGLDKIYGQLDALLFPEE
jgi:uncharacterized protein YndB with AHSA1/START domain